MNQFVQFLKNLWATVKSNPIFVAFSSAFVGAAISVIQDEASMGHIDYTRAGWNKLFGYAFPIAVSAVVHLYRPKPNQSKS